MSLPGTYLLRRFGVMPFGTVEDRGTLFGVILSLPRCPESEPLGTDDTGLPVFGDPGLLGLGGRGFEI
jgi:hypothetical protein